MIWAIIGLSHIMRSMGISLSHEGTGLRRNHPRIVSNGEMLTNKWIEQTDILNQGLALTR